MINRRCPKSKKNDPGQQTLFEANEPKEHKKNQEKDDDAKDANRLIFYIDGASKGNPGEAGAGVLMCDADGNELRAIYRYIGLATNNIAEYTALIYALTEAIYARVNSVKIYSDSELVVRQVRGIYAVKNEAIRVFYTIAKNLRSYLKDFDIEYIPREQNTRADGLANKAISTKSGGAD